MPTLHIHALDGFANDELVIRVDGVEVSRATGLSTRYQIGLARSLDIPIMDPGAEVEVELVRSGARARVLVQNAAEENVHVRVTQGGDIEVTTTRDPLRLA